MRGGACVADRAVGRRSHTGERTGHSPPFADSQGEGWMAGHYVREVAGETEWTRVRTCDAAVRFSHAFVSAP